MHVTATELLQKSASRLGDKDFLCGETTYTYAEFLGKVRALAGGFVKLGIAPGNTIAIMLSEPSEVFPTLFAAWWVGARVAPINLRSSRDYIKVCLELAAPDLIVKDSSQRILHGSKQIDWHDIPISGELMAPLSIAENNLILFTSGSTGNPKGVGLSETRVMQNALAVVEALGLSEATRLFINTPPFYTSAIIHFLTQLACGGTLIAKSGFRFGSDLAKELAESEATALGGAPIHAIRLANSATLKDLRRLKTVMSSGEHFPQPLLQQFREALPHIQLVIMYGLTEVSGRLTVLEPQFMNSKTHSVGRPLPGMQLSIVDDSGKLAKAGVFGEVYVKGPMLMTGYLGKETQLNAFGFPTGDYGYLDSDGFLFLEGRKDGVFKSGAEKVSIQRIQDAFYSLESVKEVLVYPERDAVLGTAAAALVVLKDGYKQNRLQLVSQLKKLVEPTHIPKQIRVVDSLPRLASGKVDRNSARKAKAS